MNQVEISGVIEDMYEVTGDLIFARLNSEGAPFYVYWGKDSFKGDLIDKFVIIVGTLEYIKVRKETNADVRRILAIFVKGMECYDI